MTDSPYDIEKRISLLLELKPMACPRPRVAGRFAYMPTNYILWKKKAVTFIKQQHKEKMLEGPVYIDMTAVFPRPQRLMRKKDPRSRILKSTKPDIDNIVKAVLDALQDAKVVKDDSQVVGIMALKFYGAMKDDKKSERGCIKIDIYPIKGE